MRRPTVSALALIVPLAVSACGMIAGLGPYGSGDPDAGTGSPIKTHPSGGDAAMTDGAVTTPGDDGPGPPEGDDAGDDAEDDDAGDAGTADTVDGESAADSGEDAAAVCKSTCGGCCDTSWTCHGGASVDTCGTGGEACVNCSSSGKVCSSVGACVASSPVEAGPPPMCSVGNCKNKCSLLQAPCCKSDQTCGCAVLGLLLCN